MFSKHAKWLFPLLAILIFTPFSSWLDLKIATSFHDMGGKTHHFIDNDWTDAFFEYGVIPAQIVAVMASLFYLLSFIQAFWKQWRQAFLVLILTMAVGEGLIVHGILKDHWGRPRPKQVEQFGGNQQFRPYYEPHFSNPQPSKSFTCGHCGMGFYFLTFTVIGLRYNKRWLIWGGLFVGLLLGSIMGLSRMAQGGHFLTDVLWSGLIIWWTAVVSDWFVFNRENHYARFNKTSK